MRKPDLVWDTYEIIQKRAQEIEKGADVPAEDARRYAASDQEHLRWEWGCLCDELTLWMNDQNRWRVEGYTYDDESGKDLSLEIYARTGAELLKAILPKVDCRFRLWKEEDGVIRLQNFHHDSTGGREWYTIVPNPLIGET